MMVQRLHTTITSHFIIIIIIFLSLYWDLGTVMKIQMSQRKQGPRRLIILGKTPRMKDCKLDGWITSCLTVV